MQHLSQCQQHLCQCHRKQNQQAVLACSNWSIALSKRWGNIDVDEARRCPCGQCYQPVRSSAGGTSASSQGTHAHLAWSRFGPASFARTATPTLHCREQHFVTRQPLSCWSRSQSTPKQPRVGIYIHSATSRPVIFRNSASSHGALVDLQTEVGTADDTICKQGDAMRQPVPAPEVHSLNRPDSVS